MKWLENARKANKGVLKNVVGQNKIRNDCLVDFQIKQQSRKNITQLNKNAIIDWA